jgi:hypothetical protein
VWGEVMTRRTQLLLAVVLAGAAAAAWWGSRFENREPTGYVPNPEGVREFLAELDQPLFRGAAPEVVAGAQGKDTFLYRSSAKAHQALYGAPWRTGRQGIGDCVSWGWAHGVWIAQSVDWETGRLAQPPPFPLTESIYGGSRVEARGKPGDGRSPVGGFSDGSYGAAAARWVRDWGVIYRSNAADYQPDRAKSWGAYGNGGQGDGGKLDDEAKRNPVRHVALVTTWDEAAAAIESGYPVVVCSMQGFRSTRDANGYAEASGQWAHCMVFVAVRYAKNGSPEDALLCLNSWGESWITGPVWPADMPAGSFWVRRPIVERMLRGEDSFAVGGTNFQWRDLDNHGWQQLPPASVAGAIAF